MDNFEKEQIKERITDFAKIHLIKAKKSKGNNAWACPFCGSGTGKTGTSAMSIKDKTFNCPKCGESGDIFTLASKVYGLNLQNDFPEIGERLQNDLGISNFSSSVVKSDWLSTRSSQDSKKASYDYSGYISGSILRLKESQEAIAYLHNRGFTDETIEKFRLGYDSEKDAVTTPYNAESTYYILRSIEGKCFYKPKSSEAGSESLFNKEALNSGEFVFVTESAFDAMSFEQLGYRSVAIGGAGYDKLIKAIEEMEEEPKLILALDNDEAGKNTTRKLEKALQERLIDFTTFTYPEGIKDANDALSNARVAFTLKIFDEIHKAEQFFENQLREKEVKFLETSNHYYCNEFLNNILAGNVTPLIPTGFKKLDKVFDGGLQEGLYIVGAISSLGKTTLVTQIADQIAQQRKKVLFFSLEMARTELITRSISRHTFQIYKDEDCYSLSNAKTSKSVKSWKFYDEKEHDLMKKATEQYLQYASNFFVFEGVGDIGVTQIRKTIAEYSKILGETPVVFIDYLQLLAPYNDRSTDKQNTDKAVLELKRISRDFKTPVIAVSSLNRQSYSTKMSMESFKESGAIEYSSDVLIGLQFRGVGDVDKEKDGRSQTTRQSKYFDVNKAKSDDPREIELVILKNRNGRSGDTINYRYRAKFNCFEEA